MKVILFGATRMVGQAVLRECLLDDEVESVLTIARSASGQTHAKLHVVLLQDLFEFNAHGENLQGYDACFFCLGVTAAGLNEAEYTRLTYDLTIGWAQVLAQLNPSITFIYVSGAGTGGNSMWAKVKGRTEKTLLKLLPNAYMFRLAVLQPMNRENSKTRWTRIGYAILGPLLPLVRLIAPGAVVTTEELGRAMIRVARHGASKRVLENRDLRALGEA